MFSFLSNAVTIQNFSIFTAADVVPCGGSKKSPVNHYSADYIFWSFGIIGLNLRYFENRVMLKPVLGGMVRIAHFILGHEQTLSN